LGGIDRWKISKDFIYGTESLIDFFLKKPADNGGFFDDCKEQLRELCETPKERIKDEKVERLELELWFREALASR